MLNFQCRNCTTIKTLAHTSYLPRPKCNHFNANFVLQKQTVQNSKSLLKLDYILNVEKIHHNSEWNLLMQKKAVRCGRSCNGCNVKRCVSGVIKKIRIEKYSVVANVLVSCYENMPYRNESRFLFCDERMATATSAMALAVAVFHIHFHPRSTISHTLALSFNRSAVFLPFIFHLIRFIRMNMKNGKARQRNFIGLKIKRVKKSELHNTSKRKKIENVMHSDKHTLKQISCCIWIRMYPTS